MNAISVSKMVFMLEIKEMLTEKKKKKKKKMSFQGNIFI